jgi:hypothetical protein
MLNCDDVFPLWGYLNEQHKERNTYTLNTQNLISDEKDGDLCVLFVNEDAERCIVLSIMITTLCMRAERAKIYAMMHKQSL